MGEQLLLLVKEIHMAAEKLDISDLIATIMDVGLMPHSIPSASASTILPSISCNTSSKGVCSCEAPSSSEPSTARRNGPSQIRLQPAHFNAALDGRLRLRRYLFGCGGKWSAPSIIYDYIHMIGL
jgi:hypothetical protein